jgi:peptidoglycan L-alanyl-D-glutamate endopeptidase CwlK
VSLDAISLQRLQSVNPVLAGKITQLAEILAPEGLVVRVTAGLRSWAEQDVLYAQGRITPGKVVTNARGGESWHNLGCAVDMVPMDQIPPQPDWNLSHPVWARMVAVGESLGLYSGSEFCSIKDWPHFQLTAPYPIGAPNDEARSIYLAEGAEAFWGTLTA